MPLGGAGERAGELRRGDVAVRADQQRSGIRTERGMAGTRRRGLEPLGRDAGGRLALQRRRLPGIERDLERADPAVLDVNARLAPHVADPIVVQIEAAKTEVEERAAGMGFDVWREHPGRRLRGAAGDRAIVDDRAVDAAHRQAARDRAADDAGADDEDGQVIRSW